MFEKRHIVLAALVVALGVAVYINRQFADPAVQTNADPSSQQSNLGDAQYVNNPSTILSSSPTSGEDESSSKAGQGNTLTDSAKTYFSEARVSRQKSRDEALDKLNEIIESTTLNEKQKTEAVKQKTEIAKNIQQEDKIESLIKAKKFADCMVFIENGKANVTVACDGLLANDTVTINDIVNSQTGIAFKDITIIEVK